MDPLRNELTDRFDPTFTGSRQERRWIRDALGGFYVERWFTDVLYRVQGGKEATVYCCRAHPLTGLDLIAAKVFRPRVFRAMRNDALYKQGRGFLGQGSKRVLDSRSHRALRKKTSYGRALDTSSWVRHEYGALERLHEAGADVPRPLAIAPNAILMEFVGDEVRGAPILHGVAPDPEEAQALFERLLHNVKIMLSQYTVHADLSAYNVLYDEGAIRIIDFPQAIDALNHPQGFELFARDIDRLCRYFRRRGVETDPVGLAYELWERWIE